MITQEMERQLYISNPFSLRSTGSFVTCIQFKVNSIWFCLWFHPEFRRVVEGISEEKVLYLSCGQ